MNYIKDLREKIWNCNECRVLNDLIINGQYVNKQSEEHVALGKSYGYGNVNASLMIVGVGPSCYRAMNVERLSPFNFKTKAQDIAGRNPIMYDCMRINNIDFEDVYVSNLIKCSTKNDDKPASYMIEFCKEFLEEEIKKVKPKVIVALGKTVMNYFNIGVNKVKENGYNNNIIGIYHPSYISRRIIEKKKSYIESWKIVKKLLNDTISE